MDRKARAKKGPRKGGAAKVQTKDGANSMPQPSPLPEWHEVVAALKKDLTRSVQLSEKDFSIRINAR